MDPGATRLALLGACPWLSYSAPLALRLLYLRAIDAADSFPTFEAKPLTAKLMSKFLIVFFVLLCSSTSAHAQTRTVPAPVVPGRAIVLPPEKANPSAVPRFEAAPIIDGQLDDDVWRSAAVFKDFYQTHPGDNIAPSRPTEVLLGYDSRFLYIAFHAFDEPASVRATLAKRDEIFDDDYVGVLLDTFNDQRRAYELFFNAFGMQADGIFTEGGDEDFSVDILMESKGRLTTDGYVVEVAIPFKSLRYRAGKDILWGVQFQRVIKRFNDETDSWMPLSRDRTGMLNQSGHLTGLEGISTESILEIIPSLTISETGQRVGHDTSGRACR